MNPKIRIYGAATAGQIGKWVGFAKKRLRYLREFRLNNAVSFEERRFLSDAQITIRAVRVGLDIIRIKVRGAAIRFQKLLTVTDQERIGAAESSQILTPGIGVGDRILASFQLTTGEDAEPIVAEELPALAPRAQVSYVSGVTNVFSGEFLDPGLGTTAISKRHGTVALDALSVPPPGQLRGGFTIPFSRLPSLWQDATGGDPLFLTSLDSVYISEGEGYVIYWVGRNNTEVNWTLPDAENFFVIAVPRDEMPDKWEEFETFEFSQIVPGSTLSIPYGGVSITTDPTPAGDPESYFTAGRRVWTSSSLVNADAGVSIDTFEIVNGVVHENGTISGTVQFRFVAVGFFDLYRARPMAGYVLDDLRTFLDTPVDGVAAGTYVDPEDTEVNISCSIQVDPYYGIWVGYTKERLVNAGPTIIDTQTIGGLTVNLLEGSVTRTPLRFIAERFTFSTSTRTWSASSLPTHQMSITTHTTGASYDGGVGESIVNDEADDGVQPLRSIYDGEVIEFSDATLAYDNVAGVGSGGWTVTQAAENTAPFFFPTSVGIFYVNNVASGTIWFGADSIYTGGVLARERAYPLANAPNTIVRQLTGELTLYTWTTQLVTSDNEFIDFGTKASITPLQNLVTYFPLSGDRPTGSLLTIPPGTVPGYPGANPSRKLETLPRPNPGCSIYAPRLFEENDGVLIASKTAVFDIAYELYQLTQLPLDRALMEAEYTILINNFAPRSLIELALRGGGFYLIL